MFGTYRLSLAILVVFQHIACFPVVGNYAVHGFFILSGYLMTLIMHENYGYSFKGKIKFVFNRVLRLYPIWICVLAISILIFNYWDGSELYRSYMYMPGDISEWAQNVSLIFISFFPGGVSPRVSPATWALTVELLFYVLICIGLSKSKKATCAWFFLGLFYTAISYFMESPRDYHYGSLFAGSLPFSIGALIYHYREWFIHHVENLGLGKIIFIFLFNVLISISFYKFDVSYVFKSIPYFMNYIISSLFIVKLLSISSKDSPFFRLDRRLGEYSYPIYLIHWQIGFLVSELTYYSPIKKFSIESIIVFFITLIGCTITSYVLIKLIDGPVNKIRANIKNSVYEYKILKSKV